MADAGYRWEWRSFGRQFGAAEERIAQLTPGSIQESDEIYFLSSDGDNVKVRDGLMDVKALWAINPDALQQWAPIMKLPFPLPATDTEKVLQALHSPATVPSTASYGLEEFVDAFAGPGSHIGVVRVHKRRVRYTVEGCMAELSDISVGGEATRTIAVESEDAAAVTHAVEHLGLSGYTNISYPRGLAALVEHQAEHYAVIDVGTNSVKLHIAERAGPEPLRKLVDRSEITQLGEELATTGVIGEAALDRTVVAISGMINEATHENVRAVAAVGTAALRNAENGPKVVAAIRKRTGLQVEVISGEEEARLAFLATKAALGPTAGSLVIFDTGGGSSQFTFGQGAEIDQRFSVNVGAARYTKRFGLDHAVSDDVLYQALSEISADLAVLDQRPAPDILVGMGGAITNITAVNLGLAKYDPDIVQGAVVARDEIDHQIKLYQGRDSEARRSIIGLQPKRAEVILAGACIVRTIMEKLGKTSLTVSDHGLRHGVLAERFGP
jgi:exopolyphosphatase/guanosine-5'-triphosphate,3'-diphosphate pyrophosphatase